MVVAVVVMVVVVVVFGGGWRAECCVRNTIRVQIIFVQRICVCAYIIQACAVYIARVWVFACGFVRIDLVVPFFGPCFLAVRDSTCEFMSYMLKLVVVGG